MSSDPAMADGLNWYRYANNNPIMYRDPTGLDSGRNYSAEEELGGTLEQERARINALAEEKLAEAREHYNNVMNAQSDGERATAVQAALDFEAGLSHTVLRAMMNLDPVFMDQQFREVLNLSTITGRDIAVNEVLDSNGNILKGADGKPLWTEMKPGESVLHDPGGTGHGIRKFVNDAGQEVIIKVNSEDPTNVSKMTILGSNMNRLFDDNSDWYNNQFRGTFNYQNAGWWLLHMDSLAHSDLDMKWWYRHEALTASPERLAQVQKALFGINWMYTY